MVVICRLYHDNNTNRPLPKGRAKISIRYPFLNFLGEIGLD